MRIEYMNDKERNEAINKGNLFALLKDANAVKRKYGEGFETVRVLDLYTKLFCGYAVQASTGYKFQFILRNFLVSLKCNIGDVQIQASREALNLNKKTDADIIARLEGMDNKQGYIKRLIREDIEAHL